MSSETTQSREDVVEAQLYDLLETLRKALTAEDLTPEERATWIQRIEAEMSTLHAELDQLLHSK
jgi:hypothetical protein